MRKAQAQTCHDLHLEYGLPCKRANENGELKECLVSWLKTSTRMDHPSWFCLLSSRLKLSSPVKAHGRIK